MILQMNINVDFCFQGLYKRVRQGSIKEFTGIDQSYERPVMPDLTIDTENFTLEECTKMVLDLLEKRGILPKICKPGEPVPELFISKEKLATARKEVETLDSVEVNDLDVQWIQVLAEGWAAPLKGFMREDQYLQVQYLLESSPTTQTHTHTHTHTSARIHTYFS